MPEGFNWFLILISVVVGLLVLVGCVYVLIEYQHPEDRNQAWFPKIVVVFGLTLAVVSVLMFPLDVANKAACSQRVMISSCHYTLPMYQLWLAVFITNLVLVFAFIPFTLFFYEADSDFTFFQKIKSGILWALMFMVMIGLVIGILYALVGFVIYPTQELSSGVVPITALQDLNATYGDVDLGQYSCIPPAWVKTDGPCGGAPCPPASFKNCTAFQTPIIIKNWKLRVSLPVYVMAIQSVIGWLLFLVFAGVGVLAAPIDWIQQWRGRPTSVITKSEYMRRARIIAQRSKEVLNLCTMMRRQEKDRRWRSNFKRLEREVVSLEEDEYQLERVFPQGEDGDVRWVLFMIGFWVTGFMGVIGIFISLAWLVHIAVYMLPPVPLHPMLNDLFVVLDNVFSLFGVAAFAGFCLYLMVVAIKGNFMLGLNFVFIKLYPMRPGATMMSSFLVNTAVILTMAPAIIQFCASAFAVYGNRTDIFDIFGNQVMYLQGIQWLYNFNIFLYGFYIFVGLSVVFMCLRGRKQWERKRDKFAVYAED
mmetsp:Transcript_6763/g.16842  ORF Transcript_6763/g.16842 Transcript_6763/m.16842 type:complete len:534 (-) Transcript_6763:748-2349(-)